MSAGSPFPDSATRSRVRTERLSMFAVIAVPALVLPGSADTLTKPEAQREIATLIQGAELETINGAGHIVPLEAPRAFARHPHDFLRRTAP
jgi:hypothetical protein